MSKLTDKLLLQSSKLTDELLLKSKDTFRQGIPCKHPGCASHLSHPCEDCGRYAAGMANGPDVDYARRYIEKLGANNPVVQAVRFASIHNDWTWEQTLVALVIELEKRNKQVSFL